MTSTAAGSAATTTVPVTGSSIRAVTFTGGPGRTGMAANTSSPSGMRIRRRMSGASATVCPVSKDYLSAVAQIIPVLFIVVAFELDRTYKGKIKPAGEEFEWLNVVLSLLLVATAGLAEYT